MVSWMPARVAVPIRPERAGPDEGDDLGADLLELGADLVGTDPDPADPRRGADSGSRRSPCPALPPRSSRRRRRPGPSDQQDAETTTIAGGDAWAACYRLSQRWTGAITT